MHVYTLIQTDCVIHYKLYIFIFNLTHFWITWSWHNIKIFTYLENEKAWGFQNSKVIESFLLLKDYIMNTLHEAYLLVFVLVSN